MAPRTAPPFRADRASTVDGNALTRDQQRAQLDLVVQTAAELWGS